MSGEQSYIVRLLRRVETSLAEHDNQVAGSLVSKITLRVSQADNVQEALEMLYCVEGFDRFALRLMWSLEKMGIQTSDLNGTVMDYEIEKLIEDARLPLRGKSFLPTVVKEVAPDEALDRFYEALHKFGRILGESKRKAYIDGAFKGIDAEVVYRILNETAALQQAADAVGKQDAKKFAEAVAGFINYALDHELLADVRIVNILENANLTLQTVLEAAGPDDFDSLSQTIELLQRPKDLLE
jgi:hypothetical protein